MVSVSPGGTRASEMDYRAGCFFYPFMKPMKCTDCNGSGQYVGLGLYPAEPCESCGGTGIHTIQAKPTSQPGRYAQIAGRISVLTGVDISAYSDGFWKVNTWCFPNVIALETKDVVGQGKLFTLFGVSVDNINEGLQYLLLGDRRPHQSNNDRVLFTWFSKDHPRPVVLDHAQKHYLILYERDGQENRFQKIWSV